MPIASVPGVQSGQAAIFPRSEFERRQAAVRRNMAEGEIDVLLVTGPENIFYLTGQQTPGYSTFQALILPQEGDVVFIVRQLELANFIANTFVGNIAVYQDNDNASDFLIGALRDNDLAQKRIGIDKKGFFLPVALYDRLRDGVSALQDGSDLVERERIVKSPDEQAKIRQAARYVDAAQYAGIGVLASADNENDVVSAMVGAAIKAGGEYVGMEPLVAAGKRTGIPHHTWRRGPIRRGDNLILEPACCHDRYHAVLMRSAIVGEPTDEFARCTMWRWKGSRRHWTRSVRATPAKTRTWLART